MEWLRRKVFSKRQQAETAPVIFTWEPKGDRRYLANVFVDELIELGKEDLEKITKQELEERFGRFKANNPLHEDDKYGYLDLYLVYVEAHTRNFHEWHDWIDAQEPGYKPTEQDINSISVGWVEDMFYHLFDKDSGFWPSSEYQPDE